MDEPQVAPAETEDKARLLDALYASPKHRQKLLGLIKEFKPELRIPEIDTPHETLEALKPHLEEIGKTRAALDKERAEIAAERSREHLQRRLNLSDDEFRAVASLAKDKGIQNLETATDYYRMGQQAAAPRTAPATPMQLPNVKELIDNPTQWARSEAFKALHEMGRR